jgi:hypothetical protein
MSLDKLGSTSADERIRELIDHIWRAIAVDG